MPRRALACLAVALGLSSPSARGDLIVGTTNPNSGSSAPFSGGYLGEYQQVYDARAFGSVPGGIETITAMSFGTIEGAIGPADPQSITMTVSLSTIAAGPGGLSTDFAANRGADNTVVFSGTLTYTPSRDFTIDFTIPMSTFVYDSSLGNLLLDITVTSAAGGQSDGIFNFFAADTSGNLMSRVYLQRPLGPGTPGIATADNVGLVTEFGATHGVNLLGVPEPSSLALAGIGLALLASHRARRAARLRRRGDGR